MTIEISRMLEKLTDRQDLNLDEAELLMAEIMAGKISERKMAAFLVALKMKGESKDEVAAFARVMRENAIRIRPNINGLVDSCGTGGDGLGTFNISTTAAIIAAGAWVKIAKHGNRSVSSKCGSADVLEQLGVKMLQPEDVKKCIEKIGIGFMFAPYFHPAMKNVAPVRKELGMKTVFNILGPLTNPAGADAQVIGVYDRKIMRIVADALTELDVKRALVVHSDGMDEIGLGKTNVTEIRDGTIEEYVLDGKEFGFSKRILQKINSNEESARIIRNILGGVEGAEMDVAILNAAAVIYVAGAADSIERGIELAMQSIDSGNAMRKLDKMIEFGKTIHNRDEERGGKNGHP